VVYSLVRFLPGAYHFPEGGAGDEQTVMSKMFYYTFVTYTSTGYGDITPILPSARSLATLISTTGQLYVAVIIAMLVGKFSSTAMNNPST
jgi:voltage-gated potassium channel